MHGMQVYKNLMIHNPAMTGVLAVYRKERLHKGLEHHQALEGNSLQEEDKKMFILTWVTCTPLWE